MRSLVDDVRFSVASNFSGSAASFFAMRFLRNVEEIVSDESTDAIAFNERLQEAATARAAYCRQAWEGKRIDYGMDIWTQLNLEKAMSIPKFAQDKEVSRTLMSA